MNGRSYQSDAPKPLWWGLMAGLYPLLFFYSNNFTLLDSVKQIAFYSGLFLGVPVVMMLLFSRSEGLFKSRSIWLTGLAWINLAVFFMAIQFVLTGRIRPLLSVGIVVGVVPLAWAFRNYIRRIAQIQAVLAILALFKLIPAVYEKLTYQDAWQQQPDAIVTSQFQQKPNVYFIQPDGYPSFKELKRGYYQLDPSMMETFLAEEGFTTYPDFRANYASTLTTNSAVFVMKHHYYHYDLNFSESMQARNVIMGNNPVLQLFKNNGYSTHFISEKAYLLANHPTIGFDTHNFENEPQLIDTELRRNKDALADFYELLEQRQGPTFAFVELFNPAHITVTKAKAQGAAKEKELWLQRLDKANLQMRALIQRINEKDPTAVVVLMADHGGYVGMDYMNQAYERTTDGDKIRSIFSSLLAIRWPDNQPPAYQDQLKTSVNTFRILAAYLSGDESLLEHLEEDASYTPIKTGAKKGIYSYIDTHGNITFQRQSLD